MHTIDAILNKYTMYRVVLYGLALLLAVAEIFALTGTISISAFGLLLSIVVLCTSCYFSNKFFAWILQVPHNTESWLITALILCCILPPVHGLDRVLLTALAGLVAMASKYVLVYRGTHVFNPAAIAAFILSVASLLPATWWIATPYLTPFTVLLALTVLRKQRQFTLFFTFSLAAFATLLFVSCYVQGQTAQSTLWTGLTSWPIVFMGSIMLTEPNTLAPTKYYRLLYALLVGVIFSSELRLGVVSSTPQTALIIGNLFTFVFAPAFGTMLRLRHITKTSPVTYDLAFDKPVKHFNFKPGQYMEWTLPHASVDSRGNRRTFSVASSPTEDTVHVGFKHFETSSSFKKALLALRPGKYVRVAHAAGTFTLPADAGQPLLFIAGGIGITPYRSMVKYLTDTHQTRDMVLLYSAAHENEFVYRDIWQAAQEAGLTTKYTTARLTPNDIQQIVPDVAKRLVYISGPDAMVTSYKQMLRSLGVPTHHIKTDHFAGY